MMKRLKSLLYLLIFCYMHTLAHANTAPDCVILLHGLGRTHRSMEHLQATLHRHHYYVVNHTYPSTQKTIHYLANTFLPPMIAECLHHRPSHIHVVTHSLGGLIIQEYLSAHTIPKLQYIIMLGPPNHGSPLADLLHTNWIYQWLLGPAGQELTTHTEENIHFKTPLHVGVIAGNHEGLFLKSWLFHEENDGKVSVSSTKTTFMQDFILLPVGHTFMMRNHLVENQILTFLDKGHFKQDTHRTHENHLIATHRQRLTEPQIPSRDCKGAEIRHS